MTQMTTLAGHALAPFAFGTMQFGGTADHAASARMFEACRAAGIRHFDTAWIYTEGVSERILGRLIAKDRENLFIASKVGYAGGAGGDTIRRQFDESRNRLGSDVIDLLYIHRFDDETPLEATFEVLAALQQAGQVRFVGVSNYAAWQVMKAQHIAAALGTRVDAIQPMYNLVKRQAEVELLPMCASEGIAPVCYSPLGGGLLTGKYAAGGSGRLTEDDRYAARYGQAAMRQAADGLVALARELEVDPATLAVAWVARHPSHPVPILSARSVAQLTPSLAGMDYPMTAELRDRMSALMPAPPPATDRIEEA